MDKAKIRLSAAEADLVSDASLILTKNRIMQKANWMLQSIHERQRLFAQTLFPSMSNDVLSIPAKISKGENYLGLPYLILDYPRSFKKEGSVAIRIMFWWGNFFSVTLHLSGEEKIKHQSKLLSALPHLQQEFFICIHQEEWEHHFEPDNYRLIAEIGTEKSSDLIRNREFVKVAKKIPLLHWEQADEMLFETFVLLMKTLAD